MRIAAGVVAMPVRVQHDLNGFVGNAFQRGFNLVRERQEFIIHHDNAVVANGGADIAARAFNHVNAAGNLLYFHFNFAEILALGEGVHGPKQSKQNYGKNTFPHRCPLSDVHKVSVLVRGETDNLRHQLRGVQT